MDCTEARPLLDDDLDGRLAEADRERLDAHVAECAECRAAREDLARLRRVFAAVPAVSAPAGLRDAVLASLPPRRGRLRRIAPWLGAFAAAAAAVVLAVNLIPSSAPFPDSSVSEVATVDAARPRSEPAAPGRAGSEAVRAPRTAAEFRRDGDRLRAHAEEEADHDDGLVPGPEPVRETAGALDRGAGREPSDAAATEPAPTAAPTAAKAPAPDPAARPAEPLPGLAAPSEAEAIERDRDVGGKKVADARSAGRASLQQRIVVFSDRSEADRFLAALRQAAPPPRAPERESREPVARRPTPAPDGLGLGGGSGARGAGAAGAADDAAGERAAAKSGSADQWDAADAKIAAPDFVATAAAGELAEAAATGRASVLAEISLPADAPRVAELLRSALDGRNWAVPLSERLYARARGPASEPSAGGTVAGDSGPVTGASGGRGGGAGAGTPDEPPEPLLEGDGRRRAAPARRLRIVVLVLD